ncbi:phospholipase B [Phlegmacium glaucopus]|nr:phospholipase B [Phlegmacium glaucopus]
MVFVILNLLLASLLSPFISQAQATVFHNHRSLIQRSENSILDYRPTTNVECPDLSTTSLLRYFTPQNQSLHPEEEAYINTRANTVLPQAWEDWLGNGSSLGYNLSSFSAPYPTIGIAMPGGGLRAAQYGAACLHALDSRNASSKSAGTGGLLQVASYITGLSGGSWLTGSLVFNNMPILKDLVFGNGQNLDGWLLDVPLVTPDGVDIFSQKNQAFYDSILASVIAKANLGLDTSLTDPWSRMISYHFLNQTSRQNIFTNDTAHGAGQLWSQIPQVPAYQNHLLPFPIIVADSRPVGSNATTILSLDSVAYEITPLEMASYDPSLSMGMNLTYVGTKLTNGKTDTGSSCVTGFDQAGFIMGTSASLFNQIFDFASNTLSQFSQSDSSGLLYVISQQLKAVRTRANDVANWPNPFHNVENRPFQDGNSTWLELIDGSSEGENVPFGPLLVRARNVDVIVTLENSADDVNNWPNGSSLVFTSLRQSTLLQTSHQPFPPIPSTPEEFVSTGVNSRPTFFGCDPPTPKAYPLVIYLPNSPPITGDNPATNTPTFQLSYNQVESQVFFDQVYFNTISGFTPNANTPDPNWGKCFQCAVLDRRRLQSVPLIPRSPICTQCFQQYCFDPNNLTSKSELPNRKLVFTDPNPQGITKLISFITKNKFKLLGGLIGLVVFIIIGVVAL